MSSESQSSSRWAIWGIGVGVLGAIGAIGIIYVIARSRSKKPKSKKKPQKKKKSSALKRRESTESIEACSKETYLAVLEALINTMQKVMSQLSQMEEEIKRRNPSATRQQISDILSREYSEMMENTRAQVFEAHSTTEQACQIAHSEYQGDPHVGQAWDLLVELEKKLEYRGIIGTPQPQPQPQSQLQYQQQYQPQDTIMMEDKVESLPKHLTLEKVTQVFTTLMERLTVRMEDAMRLVKQRYPPPLPEERENLIKQLYMQYIQEVQIEVFEESRLNANLLDTAIQQYLQYPIFKATVDRLREEQRMTFARLSQQYWPS